jgi:DNA repair protein RadC
MVSTVTHFRWKIERVAETLTNLRAASDVFGVVRGILEEEAQEVFLALYLSTQNQLNGYSEVTRGTLDASLVHPREVFRGALLANAASVIVAHNHPSGDPTPSAEDRVVTRQLKVAGELLGIELLDHVIVGHKRYMSFADAGLL